MLWPRIFDSGVEIIFAYTAVSVDESGARATLA